MVRASDGDDRLQGGDGDHRLFGDDGADALSGGTGDRDFCRGGTGVDTIRADCENPVSP